MRKDLPFNFDWLFAPAFDESLITTRDPLPAFAKIALPHTVKELPYNDFDEKSYQFVAAYVRDFETPAFPSGDRLLIRFGAVMTVADVWLNGSFLGRHEGGFTPFEYDLTDRLDPGGRNRLVVRVDAGEIADVPPFGNVVDYLCYGGIYREVALLIRPAFALSHLAVKTLEAPSLREDEMVLEARLVATAVFPEDATFQAVVLKDGHPAFSGAVEAKPEGDRVVFRKLVPGIRRWDLETPELYELEVAVFLAGTEADRIRVRFGFRTAVFTAEGFILNNRKVKLYGLNRHQSWPYVGYAMPARIQRKDAEILKEELGVNLVRTSHYMQSDAFIDRCDELGLLVFEEMPGWQHIGGEAFKENALANLRAMILAHQHHPSIVLWGVRINESPDDHDFYVRTNALAHELDDSRQTGGVRNFARSELLEDVYTYNDFSHTGENPGLRKASRVRRGLVPYLVTEHNGHIFPTKKFDHEAKRIEHALRHATVLDAAFAADDVAGAIGWCMNDYNTHVEFGSGDRICYHGVMDMFRLPKYAAAVYASQQEKKPVLVVASAMTMGDHALSRIPPTVVFTNCDCVKVYRDGHYIDTFYSAWGRFPAMPHAPVIIDDYYGSRIEEEEPYRRGVARMVKKVLVAFGRHGFNLPLADRLRALWLVAIRGFTFADAERLYGKYVGDWGKEGAQYVYEGYRNDVLVARATRGAGSQATFSAVADDAVLCQGDTWDATRIVVRLTDAHGADLPYAADAFTVETTPGLAVVGPTTLALIGGSLGVYVRTTGIAGPQTVFIRPAGRPAVEVAITTE